MKIFKTNIVMFIICFLFLTMPSNSQTDSISVDTSETEFIPILNYDNNTGFGYGVKFFFFHQLSRHESFDIILYNSTKGERWFKFVFSLPDFEFRQGKKYNWAVDIILDYDKWIKYNFFGVGSNSHFAAREQYTREPIELSLFISKSLTPLLVAQFGIQYSYIRSYNFDPNGLLKDFQIAKNNPEAKYISFLLNIKYDTRNSFINPSKGFVTQSNLAYSVSVSGKNTNFSRGYFGLRYYHSILNEKLILASRLGFQQIFGNDIPIQTLLSLGGNNSLRGLLQDRYLDKASTLLNAELRFPIIYNLGGILGVDMGIVSRSLLNLNFKNWILNPVIGLRYYMQKFIIRLDIGFSKETTGIYLNFGHLF